MLDRRGAVIASLVTGAMLELGVSLATGRREAWDSQWYWTAGLPAALLASAAIGVLSGRRHWYWTVLVVPAQVAVMTLRSGEVGSLWPLMLVLSSVLSLPFVLVAFIASRFARALPPACDPGD